MILLVDICSVSTACACPLVVMRLLVVYEKDQYDGWTALHRAAFEDTSQSSAPLDQQLSSRVALSIHHIDPSHGYPLRHRPAAAPLLYVLPKLPRVALPIYTDPSHRYPSPFSGLCFPSLLLQSGNSRFSHNRC